MGSDWCNQACLTSIDFTDLNKACPKDSYPLPSIDELVDGASGNELLSMMDAHSGYNQILMHEPNEEKTSFITDSGTFCYRVMPFVLRNAGATFQRLMDKVFANQIGRNVSAYVDDILVKTSSMEKHPNDLKETLETLKQYGMKLNPAKCAFGIKEGKFLQAMYGRFIFRDVVRSREVKSYRVFIVFSIWAMDFYSDTRACAATRAVYFHNPRLCQTGLCEFDNEIRYSLALDGSGWSEVQVELTEFNCPFG